MRKPYQSSGWTKNSSYYSAPVGDRTHALYYNIVYRRIGPSPDTEDSPSDLHDLTLLIANTKLGLYIALADDSIFYRHYCMLYNKAVEHVFLKVGPQGTYR